MGSPIVPLPNWLDRILAPQIQNPTQDVVAGGDRINTQLDRLATTTPYQPEQGIVDRISQLYQPEVRATNRLYDMLDEIPQREDYKPSIWRRIGGSIVGGAAGKEFVDRPYTNAREKFTNEYEPTKDIATLERYANQNNRMMLDDIMQRQLQEQRDRETARTRDARLELDWYKQNNPDMKLVNGEDGYVYLVSPKGDQIINTQLRHGELSDMDKLKYGFENNVTLEEIRQRNRENLAGLQSELRMGEEAARQQGRVDLEHLRQTGRVRLIEERQRTGTTTNESQSQLKQRYINNAQRLIQSNPDFKDWVEFNQDGYPEVRTVESFGPQFLARFREGLSEERKKELETAREQIIRGIYGDGQAQPVRTTGTETNRTVIMIGPDGKEYNVPSDRVEDAIRDGMRRK